jgi:hypothetical protein
MIIQNVKLHGLLNPWGKERATRAKVNQHPPTHHPLDACYDLVVDESQLSSFSNFTL